MRLSDVPTARLREMLDATIRAVGSDAPEAQILRRELERRDQDADATRDSQDRRSAAG